MSTKVGTYFDLKYAKKWFVRQQGGCSSPDHFEPFSTDLMLDSYMYLYHQSDSVKECCCACGVDIAGQTALAQCYTKNVTGSSRSRTGFVDFSNTS